MTQQILYNINIPGEKWYTFAWSSDRSSTQISLHANLNPLFTTSTPFKKAQGHLIWFGSVSQSVFQFYDLRQQNKESWRKRVIAVNNSILIKVSQKATNACKANADLLIYKPKFWLCLWQPTHPHCQKICYLGNRIMTIRPCQGRNKRSDSREWRLDR